MLSVEVITSCDWNMNFQNFHEFPDQIMEKHLLWMSPCMLLIPSKQKGKRKRISRATQWRCTLMCLLAIVSLSSVLYLLKELSNPSVFHSTCHTNQRNIIVAEERKRQKPSAVSFFLFFSVVFPLVRCFLLAFTQIPPSIYGADG